MSISQLARYTPYGVYTISELHFPREALSVTGNLFGSNEKR
jgi:hypothetical protein